LGVTLYSRIVLVVLGLIVLGFIAAIVVVPTIAVRHAGSAAGATSQTPTLSSSNVPVPFLAPSLKLPPCPPGGIQTLQPSQQTGHHKVTLTWNANAPALDPAREAAGYCLYRSQKQQAAKHNPRCGACEQINRTPIVGVGCVDDLVVDNATYYYVVTAINANGEISSSSNETPARIPPNKRPAGPAPKGSYPLCRATVASP
jgi:hypothetical protein